MTLPAPGQRQCTPPALNSAVRSSGFGTSGGGFGVAASIAGFGGAIDSAGRLGGAVSTSGFGAGTAGGCALVVSANVVGGGCDTSSNIDGCGFVDFSTGGFCTGPSGADGAGGMAAAAV